MAENQTQTTSQTTVQGVQEPAPTLEAVKNAAAVVETDTVTVDIPQDGGLLAYLTGPNMKIDLTAIDFENSELTVEDGNLRLTLPEGQGEILLLDYTAASANVETAPVVILSENTSVAGNMLLSALAHANQTAADIQPAAGTEGANTVASQRGADTVSDSGFFIPESSDAGFGEDPSVISEVIAPFTIAPKFDEIIEELHPNEPAALPPVNTAPNANNDTATTHAETAVTINAIANDTDPENDALTITAANNGANGTVSIVSNQLVYTPNTGFLGTDSFTYTISDGRGGVDTATVTVNVVNTPPVAIDDIRNTHAGTPVTLNVLTNDTDADADNFSVTSTTNPSNGAITVIGGNITYTPNAGFTGQDTFTYTITDDHGATDTATVTINVTNTTPDAVNDSATTHAGTPVTISVLTNDTDPENDTLTITGANNGSNGTVAVVNGQLVYTPNNNFVGTDTFTYTITDGNGGVDTATVTVTVTNAAPDAVNDTATTHAGTPVSISVLPNDTDADNDGFTITSNTTPSNGTITLAGGVFTYTPNAGFSGTDTFTYTITDDHGATDTATVTINVTNTTPDAVNDSATTHAGTPVTISVLTNDTDPENDTLTITSNTNPSNGAITLTNGVFTYTPNTGFTGTDTFTYTITDNNGGVDTATVTVTVTNTAPDARNDSATTHCGTPVTINALANDTDPDGDTLTITGANNGSHGTVAIVNGQLVYTPTGHYVGQDSFTYTISDGRGGVDTATVTVNVTNAAPDAVNDARTTNYQTPVTINVLGNDSDADGDSFSITSTTNPSHGSISLVNGQIVYTPNNGFSGTDNFTYTITDGCGATDTASVTVNVGPRPNSGPDARNDSATTHCGTPVTINALANDTDPDGDTLTITGANNGSHGTVSIVNGQLVYTPTGHYVGQDSFTYTISDGRGGVDTATVTINVTNAAPDAVNDGANVSGGQSVWINAIGNDTDPDGDAIRIVSVGSPNVGSVQLINGQLLYSAPGSYNGTAQFTYTIQDACGAQDTATVTINIRTSGGGGGGGGGGDDCPLVLDLDGDGLSLVSLTQSAAMFDMDNDGIAERTAWVAGDDDALLVFDRDASGTIDNRNELFGNTETAEDGFARLAELDSNGDGVITADDSAFSQIQLWLDDGDGVSEDGELFGLDHFGVVAINTDGTFVDTYQNGQWISDESTFTFEDGSTGTVSDVWFNYDNSDDVAAADETLTITTEDILAGEEEADIDTSDFASEVFTAESIHGDFDSSTSSTTDTLTQIGLDAAHNTDTLA